MVRLEDETAVKVPRVVPFTEDAASITGEMGVTANETPLELARTVVVTNPTGSVVAFCACEDAMVPARTIAAMERMGVGGFMA